MGCSMEADCRLLPGTTGTGSAAGPLYDFPNPARIVRIHPDHESSLKLSQHFRNGGDAGGSD